MPDLIKSEWRSIESAPCDGKRIQVRIPGYGEKNIIQWRDGLLDEQGEDTGGWHYIKGEQQPECWSDGVCWAINEDGRSSINPTHWKIPEANFLGDIELED